jgi:hypothetical protein
MSLKRARSPGGAGPSGSSPRVQRQRVPHVAPAYAAFAAPPGRRGAPASASSPASRAQSPASAAGAGLPPAPRAPPRTPVRPLAFNAELSTHKELGVAPGFLPPLESGGSGGGVGGSSSSAGAAALAMSDFVVVAELGRGSSGVVYRMCVAPGARRRGLRAGDEYALKVSEELPSVRERARQLEEFTLR